MNVIKLHFQNLRNEAHYRFYSAFMALVAEFPAVKEKIAQLFTDLEAVFAREDVAVDLLRKSDYTAKIAAADQRLNNSASGFGGCVQNSVHHFNPNVADAALSLKNLLKSYGNIAKKTCNEEAAAVINLLQDLATPAYASKVAIVVGLAEWITEMREACVEVVALLDARTAETASRPHERMINIRREIDPVYHSIIARIEALALIEGDEAYAAFIDRLNALTGEFNKIRQRRKSDAGDAGESSKKSF